MKTWIGSDFHWGHKNIMQFCPVTRGHYRDVDHMNQDMIQQWNNIVQPEDMVYMLGDVAFMNGFEASKILNSLTGRKILIKGNHDNKTIKDLHFRSAFVDIHDYLEINYAGHRIIMSHFPFLEWNSMHRGSLHFFGHLHGKLTNQEKYRCMDVGMDATKMILITMEDAINSIKNNEIKQHH